jgi:hypothetical protein
MDRPLRGSLSPKAKELAEISSLFQRGQISDSQKGALKEDLFSRSLPPGAQVGYIPTFDPCNCLIL